MTSADHPQSPLLAAASAPTWESTVAKYKVGDLVSGLVTRKINGGLLVHIGVDAVMYESEIDIRWTQDIDGYIGQTIECMILKIDESRRRILLSRRKLIKARRDGQRAELFAEFEVGQIREGTVKKIVDFGAFVDLGGVDGLLHITDMAWNRTADPHTVVQVDQKLQVYILKLDSEKAKIALSLKHLTPNPWQGIEERYAVNTRHTVEITRLSPNGASARFDDGIEGFIRTSEMNWTRRIGNPQEVVSIGVRVEVQVLNINREKKEISLGMKQCQQNPWDDLAKKFPPSTRVSGVVRNITGYGAFIEIEGGIDGLLHISDMSCTTTIPNPSEVVVKGQNITCVVLNVDQARKRIALRLEEIGERRAEAALASADPPGGVSGDQHASTSMVPEDLEEEGCEPLPDGFILTPELRAELERRLAALEANPEAVHTWEEVLAHLRRPR